LVETHLPHRIRSRDRDQLVTRGPAVSLQQSAESLRAFDIARSPALDPLDPLVTQPLVRAFAVIMFQEGRALAAKPSGNPRAVQ